MSSAFDTIDRQTLLDILREIVEEDELRIIRFLLSDTIINTRISGATKGKPFESNIGSQHKSRFIFHIPRKRPERSENHLATTDF